MSEAIPDPRPKFPSTHTPDPDLPTKIWAQPGASLHARETQPVDVTGPDSWPRLFTCEIDSGDSDQPDQAWCENLAERIAMSYNVCRTTPIETMRSMVRAGYPLKLMEVD